MSYTPGMILRNGTTDSVIVLKDGTLYELKRDGLTFPSSRVAERKRFPDAAAWRASLSADNGLTTTKPGEYVKPSRKIKILNRTFEYSAGTPHSQIAYDILTHFKSDTGCYHSNAKNIQQELLKMKIASMKLELDPPEYDPKMTGGPKCYDQDKMHFERSIQYWTSRIKEHNKYKDSTIYNAYATYKPKVFVKMNDVMVPLGVHEGLGKVVLNKNGYNSFGEATSVGPDGLPEMWVFCRKKFTKLSVTIS